MRGELGAVGTSASWTTSALPVWRASNAVRLLICCCRDFPAALSRSFFSLLIPRGREAEYFSLYQAAERGTSWLGTLIFGPISMRSKKLVPFGIFLALGAAVVEPWGDAIISWYLNTFVAV